MGWLSWNQQGKFVMSIDIHVRSLYGSSYMLNKALLYRISLLITDCKSRYILLVIRYGDIAHSMHLKPCSFVCTDLKTKLTLLSLSIEVHVHVCDHRFPMWPTVNDQMVPLLCALCLNPLLPVYVYLLTNVCFLLSLTRLVRLPV